MVFQRSHYNLAYPVLNRLIKYLIKLTVWSENIQPANLQIHDSHYIKLLLLDKIPAFKPMQTLNVVFMVNVKAKENVNSLSCLNPSESVPKNTASTSFENLFIKIKSNDLQTLNT